LKIKSLGLRLQVVLQSYLVNQVERSFQDTLLDELAGTWVLQGTIAGAETTHDIVVGWALGHQYLQFHDVSRETDDAGIPLYEATVFIGWDQPSGRYVCMFLDSTSGGGLANDVFGYAEPAGDKLAFIFGDDDGRLHTTFTYRRDSDI
jgi:hypothetical protein